MQLLLSMILDRLPEYEVEAGKAVDCGTIAWSRCSFWNPETEPVPDTIWFSFQLPGNFRSEENPEEAFFSDENDTSTAVILPWDLRGAKPGRKDLYLFVQDMPKAMNAVMNCFGFYEKAERDLYECIARQGNIQRLVEIMTPLFGNEITIRDEHHRYVASSYSRILFHGEDANDQPDASGYASENEIDSLKKDYIYRETEPSEEPFVYPYNEYQLLCYDIFQQDKFLYRIKISNVRQSFRSFDKYLLRFFVEFVKTYASYSFSSEDALLQEFMISLMEQRKLYTDKELTFFCRKLQWDPEDIFLAVNLLSGRNNGEMKAYSYYCIQLAKSFPYAFAFEYKGGITLAVDLTKGYEGRSDYFLEKLSEFVRDSNFRIGYSFPHRNLLFLPVLYRQAAAALEQGSRYSPSLWTYSFENYRMHYLLSRISEDFHGCDGWFPALHNLWEEDRKKGSDNFVTLQCYLECDRNLALASRKLNIHRSTLVYRLEQIQKKLKADVDSPETACLINLASRCLAIDESFM